MRISKVFRYTSGVYTVRNVVDELVECLEEIKNRDLQAAKEEFGDFVTTGALYLYQVFGIDLRIPDGMRSAQKYIARMTTARDLLIEAGLYDEERDAEDPVYYRRYTINGSNFAKAHKRDAFLALAREDMR